jgi:uncharacterized protein (DUF1810 family)
MSLDRVHLAQASPSAGYNAALAEIRQEHKTSHWIWSIFPHIEGLGRSSTARAYALRDLADALRYLNSRVTSRSLVTCHSRLFPFATVTTWLL